MWSILGAAALLWALWAVHRLAHGPRKLSRESAAVMMVVLGECCTFSATCDAWMHLKGDNCFFLSLSAPGSGGHTAEMLQMLRHWEWRGVARAVFVTAQSDTHSAAKAQALADEGPMAPCVVEVIPRSRCQPSRAHVMPSGTCTDRNAPLTASACLAARAVNTKPLSGCAGRWGRATSRRWLPRCGRRSSPSGSFGNTRPR